MLSLMPNKISFDGSEKSSVAFQRNSLKAQACDEEWNFGSELGSDDDDSKLQSKGTTFVFACLNNNAAFISSQVITNPVKYAWMSDEIWVAWKALPKLENLTLEDGKFDDFEDSSEEDDA
jgi:hypothetical protein